MINYYKTVDGVMTRVDQVEDGVWINLIDPSDEELNYLADTYKIEPAFLRAALDDEEASHIDSEDDQTLVIIDIPMAEKDDEAISYSTIPLGIVLTDENIITVCLKESAVIREFTEGKVKGVNSKMKTRFVFQIVYRVAVRFLQYLKQIDKISKYVEHQLHQSMKNKELFQLLDLEKSLVFFSTSLKADEATLEKILRGRVIKLYEEDQDLLEDVLIEIKQAIEMSNIYSSILSGTMDAFASIISNNLNIVMKFLASITIVMSVPTIIASIYGMNVREFGNVSVLVPVILTVLSTTIVAIFLYKKKMF